jgi:spoIIIJ-associated protein
MDADLSAQVARFLQDLLTAMGLEPTVSVDESPEALRLDIEGEGVELLLQRRGEGLDALQHVVNTVFRKHPHDERRIVVDCRDFRRGKDEELRKMARFLVEKARETGEPQEMGPLNSYARRVVHLAVAEDPTATSESIGDAAMKTVIISIRQVPGVGR